MGKRSTVFTIHFTSVVFISFFTFGAVAETKSFRTITVAVIDTGADTTHRAIKNKLWQDPNLPGWNPLSHGRDFSDSGNLNDEHGHGTHIAGLIAAEDELGRSSPARLMILKYYQSASAPADPLKSGIAALRFALRQKVDVINYSGGGTFYSKEEYEVMKEIEKAGILVIAAAGNESRNIDELGFYPASYKLSNVISVGAVDEKGVRMPSSNFGAKTVSIYALGKKVWSALPQGRYGTLSGTSQATALVTRSAIQLMAESKKPLTPDQVKQKLFELQNNKTIYLPMAINLRQNLKVAGVSEN